MVDLADVERHNLADVERHNLANADTTPVRSDHEDGDGEEDDDDDDKSRDIEEMKKAWIHAPGQVRLLKDERQRRAGGGGGSAYVVVARDFMVRQSPPVVRFLFSYFRYFPNFPHSFLETRVCSSALFHSCVWRHRFV